VFSLLRRFGPPWTVARLRSFGRKAPRWGLRQGSKIAHAVTHSAERTGSRARRSTLTLLNAVPGPARLAPIMLNSAEDVERLYELAVDVDLPLRLEVKDYSVLRLLTLPSRRQIYVRENLQLRVSNWTPPMPAWRGTPRPIPTSSVVQIEADPARRRIDFYVRVRESTELTHVVRALYPAVMPEVRMEGSGLPQVAVDSSAPTAVLASLPTSIATGLKAFPPALHGTGLLEADVLLTGRTPAEGADTRATSIVRLSGLGQPIEVRDRNPSRAAVDLHVHHPAGKMPNFHEPKRVWAVSTSPDGRALELSGAVDGDVDREMSWAVSEPLMAHQVAALRDVVSLDASRLRAAATQHDTRSLLGRLVEIAASGVTIHSLPETISDERGYVAPDLMAEFRRRGAAPVGLAREVQGVRQRRLAMKHHSGIFSLADHVQRQSGWRLLPRVTVLISSKRVSRVKAVLEMMSQQTYPHFEIVLVLHGAKTAELGDISNYPNLRVLEVDPGFLFGEALAAGLRAAEGDLVTKADDDDWYSPEHLWDLVLGHLYSGAEVVGKTTEYLYFERVEQTVHRRFATERFHQQVAGGAMMMSRRLLEEIGGWRPTVNSTDRSILVRVAEAGGVAYRTHGLGYLYIRHDDTHTWQRSDSHLLSGSFEQWRGLILPGEEADLVDRSRDLARRVTSGAALPHGI
jgi:hypothetical protein